MDDLESQPYVHRGHRSHRRMTKSELGERLHALQHSSEAQASEPDAIDTDREGEFLAVLHELEVYQIELEMQNRELRDSQQALEDSHDRYVNLYDFAPVGYVTLTEQGLVKEVNLTAASLLGIERKWLVDRSLAPWIAGSELPEFRSHLKKCASTDEKVTSILQLVRKDKHLIPVELASTFFQNPVTGERLLRTSMVDLTKRRQVEEERDRFFELSSDLLSVVGANGFFKRLNPAWERLLGYSREELLARPYLEFIHPDDRDFSVQEFEKLIRGGKPLVGFQNRYVRKDRSTVWITWSVVFSGSDFFAVGRDTTQETIEKQSIQNQFTWLNEMIQSIPVPLVLAEAATGQVISMSQEAKALSGGFPVGKMGNLPHEGYRFLDARGKLVKMSDWPRLKAARGEVVNGEQMTWQTPHSTTHLLVWSRIIPAKYNHPDMVIVMAQDIGPLKKKETLLQETVEKLDLQRELREDFVSALSHDLRTPLTSAKLGVQLLARSVDDPSATAKQTAKVIGSIDRMDRMIYDLLDANRIHAGERISMKVHRFDLSLLVRSTVEALSLIHRQPLKVDACEKVVGQWSRKNLRRLIENLVNNAVKYGDSSHPVTIRIETDKLAQDQVCISVHNFGNPIPPKDQANLFERFRRTESAQEGGKQGWGVGLTLVRGIVEAHGGTFSVQSTAAEGTTFKVSLPLAPPAG